MPNVYIFQQTNKSPARAILDCIPIDVTVGVAEHQKAGGYYACIRLDYGIEEYQIMVALLQAMVRHGYTPDAYIEKREDAVEVLVVFRFSDIAISFFEEAGFRDAAERLREPVRSNGGFEMLAMAQAEILSASGYTMFQDMFDEKHFWALLIASKGVSEVVFLKIRAPVGSAIPPADSL